jgi:hypothetical protein
VRRPWNKKHRHVLWWQCNTDMDFEISVSRGHIEEEIEQVLELLEEGRNRVMFQRFSQFKIYLYQTLNST